MSRKSKIQKPRKKRPQDEDPNRIYHVICPYCRKEADLVDSAVIYGKSYGYIYLCKPCDAYVGCHEGTKVPKGTPARKELRLLRKRAHDAFDVLWRDYQFCPRTVAYKWLAKNMGICFSDTHIGSFNEEQCCRVIELCNQVQ